MRRYLFYFPLLFLMVSCEIIEEDISGRAVTTIAPANDAEVPAGSVMFRWRAVDRATGYELCVATEGRIVADTLLAADTLGLARSYGCRLTLEAGRYEWTVAAFNSGYETSSPALRLTVVGKPAPEEPENPNRRTTIRKSLPAKRLLLPECRQKETLRTFRRVFRPRRLFAVGGGIARARASCSPPQGAAANGRQRRALSNRRNQNSIGITDSSLLP